MLLPKYYYFCENYLTMRFAIIFLLAFLTVSYSTAQTGTAYGIKGGLTLGSQSWNGSERELLTAYNGSLFVETINDETSLRLFGEFGYHIKGSTIVTRKFVDMNNVTYPRRVIRQPFTNLSLAFGAKNMHTLTETISGYYMVGPRVDYNLNYEIAFLNIDRFVNKFTYGATVGGGVEFKFGDAPFAAQLEFQVQPDVANQIFFQNVPYVDRNGNQFNLSQKVRNISYEITLGFKFIRKVIWVDALDDSYLPVKSKSYSRK